MTKNSVESHEQRQAELAPETHNDEQDDHRSQAHEVAGEARTQMRQVPSPTESTPGPEGAAIDNAKDDTIETMRKMEKAGRIDMDAFANEPDHDDEPR